MGKADFINRIIKRKEFLFRFWGTFLTVLALPSAVFTILGRHISIPLTGGLIIFALVFALALNRTWLVTKNLPPVISSEEFERRRLHCPCDVKLAEQVGQLAEECYRGENISPIKYEALRVKNPYILACLTGAKGHFLGYFDVIPLQDHFGALFLQGKVTEKGITHEDILAPSEMGRCKYLYISGLAVRNWETYAGHRNAFMLIWGVLKYLEHFYKKADPLAFAVAFTKEGENLLETFKLKVGADASTRLDKHTVYSIALSHSELMQRLACVPDYSPVCSLDWETNEAADSTPSPLLPPKKSVGRHRISLPSRNRRTLSLPNAARRI
jgi:hypothetical protein